MKTLNIRIFPKKLHSLSILCAEYFQKIGKFAILCTNTHNSNILVGKTPKNQDFPWTVKKFLQISAILYVGLQGYKSKYLSYHTKKSL